MEKFRGILKLMFSTDDEICIKTNLLVANV